MGRGWKQARSGSQGQGKMVTASTLWGSWGAAEKGCTSPANCVPANGRGPVVAVSTKVAGARTRPSWNPRLCLPQMETGTPRAPQRSDSHQSCASAASIGRGVPGRKEAASCTADDLIQERPFPADPGVTESAPGKSSRKMTQLASEEQAAQNHRGKTSKNQILVTPPCLHLLRAHWPRASQAAVRPNVIFN